MKRSFIFTAFLAAGLVCSSVVFPTASQAIGSPVMPVLQGESDDDTLTIGSKAPALDVEHWVQDGEGSFKPVTKFESGKVYIVEFWATWCGPCIASMPHIVETQEKYKDKGVQVISISNEDLETVEEFLDGDVRGEKDKTYRELTASYCLTTDPDGSSSEDYMRASGQNGIPCAFIVGKTGQIEWIGHPMQMDKPLASVVKGEWDREAFAKSFAAKQEMELFMMKLGRTYQRDPEAGMEMLKKKIADTEDMEVANRLKSIQLSLMLRGGDTGEEVGALAVDVLKSMEDPQQVNQLAWNLYEMFEAGDLEDKELLGKVAAIAEDAANKSDEETAWMVWDTAGHLYHASGNLDKALEAQKKAAASDYSSKEPAVAEFLKELEAEKK